MPPRKKRPRLSLVPAPNLATTVALPPQEVDILRAELKAANAALAAASAALAKAKEELCVLKGSDSASPDERLFAVHVHAALRQSPGSPEAEAKIWARTAVIDGLLLPVLTKAVHKLPAASTTLPLAMRFEIKVPVTYHRQIACTALLKEMFPMATVEWNLRSAPVGFTIRGIELQGYLDQFRARAKERTASTATAAAPAS